MIKKIKNNKVIKNILLILMAILTTLSFTLNIYNLDNLVKNISFLSTSSSIESNLSIYGPFKVGTLFLLIIGLFFYKYYQKYYFQNKKSHYAFDILSVLFSLFMIIGYSYNLVGSAKLILGSISLFLLNVIIFIGYFIFFKASLNYLSDFIMSYKEKDNKNKLIDYIFNKHPFRSTALILLVCYLPYIIAFYPGILSPDPSNQIKQFFNLDKQYKEYVVMIDENVPITNHHPVTHTLILGGLTFLGKTLGSVNAGIFMYSILQMTLLICLLSYTIYYMKKLDTPLSIRIISLLIYAFVPIFPLYGMATLKDTVFAILVIFYYLKLYECIKYKNLDRYHLKENLILIFLMIAITLFRNNGIYLIIMSFPFLLLIDKKNRLKLLGIFLAPVLFYYGFTHALLPALKVTPGSVREVLSIPFQQTARYVKTYPNEVTEEEKKAIDKILTYNTLVERYKPEISDPVKNEFNKYATKEDLKNYFKVWFNDFFKHPGVYFEATINNAYGYFYPDAKKWYVYFNYDKRLKEAGLDYHYNNLKGIRNALSDYANTFPYIPIIGSLVSIGFATWIMMYLFALLLKFKKYDYLIMFTPVISLILVCIASPVNTYFRYTLGYTMAIPLLFALTYSVIKNKDRKKEVK